MKKILDSLDIKLRALNETEFVHHFLNQMEMNVLKEAYFHSLAIADRIVELRRKGALDDDEVKEFGKILEPLIKKIKFLSARARKMSGLTLRESF
ncbi:MAG: hypothetical protein JSV20_03150 [Candidatus Bathyarchaeota archaeon]|nr:MAG: hypothetical protein JSV20_03150 [Candidatus Bathyarchaeota archaeon]